MTASAHRRRRHDQIKLMSVEERLDAAADILVIGLLRLLAKDGRVKDQGDGEMYDMVAPVPISKKSRKRR